MSTNNLFCCCCEMHNETLHYLYSQSHCFPRLCLSPGILSTRKHTGSASVFRRTEGDTYSVGPVTLSYPSVFPKPGTDPVSGTLRFLVFRILNDGKIPAIPLILSVIHHRQNPLDSPFISVIILDCVCRCNGQNAI
jgi:hypothetical protein